MNYQPTSVQQKIENEKLYMRNVPSQPLQPYLDARPVLTKYAVLPVVDPRAPIDVPLIQQSTFNIHNTFNPGNDTAPWSGYASNVNRESELRGQIYALQRSSQAAYVPNSNSDLYQMKWSPNQSYNQPYPNLFKKEKFDTFNPNPDKEKIGFALFNNATRQQLKDISEPVCK